MSVRDYLNHEILLAIYDKDASLVQTPLHDFFFTNAINIEADEVELHVNPLTRHSAPTNRRGAPARVLTPKGLDKRAAALFHNFNMIQFKGELLHALNEPESRLLDKRSAKEIARQMDGFGKRHQIQREVITSRVLINGQVAFDNEGRIFEGTPTGAHEVATFGMNPDHQGDLNNIINAFWSDPTADIQAQFDEIDERAGEEGVAAPTDIWAHVSVKSLMKNNTKFQAWATANPTDAAQILRGGFIEDLFGKRWHFVSHTYVNSIDGDVYPIVPKNKVLMTAPTNTDWLRCLNGITYVPTTLDVASSIESALSSLQEVAGRYAYAAVNHNPISLDAFLGDSWGYAVVEPNAVWAPTISN